VIATHAASTFGIGRKAVRGMIRTISKCHHGAQVVERSVVGVAAVRLRATSFWMMRSALTGPKAGSSRRARRSAVVRLNGGLAITRYGDLGNSAFNMSVSRTCTLLERPAERSRRLSSFAHTGSRSIAITRAPLRASGIVRAPRPAPNSTTSSSGAASAASSRARCLSQRKF
jgi:hypothetical protein